MILARRDLPPARALNAFGAAFHSPSDMVELVLEIIEAKKLQSYVQLSALKCLLAPADNEQQQASRGANFLRGIIEETHGRN